MIPKGSNDSVRSLKSLTRSEYLRWRWVECTEFHHSETMLVRLLERTPDEVLRAEAEWEAFSKAWLTSDPPTYDLVAHLKRQREFSIKTFGPSDRNNGIIDHIRKELLEIEQEPTDLQEWIDVALLAFDGAWRAGFPPWMVAEAFRLKLEKNEQRKWPDWRTVPEGQAIEHLEE